MQFARDITNTRDIARENRCITIPCYRYVIIGACIAFIVRLASSLSYKTCILKKMDESEDSNYELTFLLSQLEF